MKVAPEILRLSSPIPSFMESHGSKNRYVKDSNLVRPREGTLKRNAKLIDDKRRSKDWRRRRRSNAWPTGWYSESIAGATHRLQRADRL